VIAAVGLHAGRLVRPSEAGIPHVAEFRAPAAAFAFAAEALRMVDRYNERHTGDPLAARLGAHYDTLWFVGEDVIGDAPAVAAHLAGLAEPGTVCATPAALSRLGSAAGWDIREKGRTTVEGVQGEMPILMAKPRRQAAGTADLPGGEAAARPRVAPVAPVAPSVPVARTPGQEIAAAVTEIGRAVVNEIVERSRGINEEKVRAAIRRAGGHHGHHRDLATLDPAGVAEVPADYLEQRKKRAARKASGAVAGFVSHATSFALVGAGLVALNVLTGSSFPWAFFPIGGWAIGLISHWQGVRAARRKNREMQGLEGVSTEQLALVEKIQRTAAGFGAHAAAYGSVIAYLAGINLITSPGHLWFLYPLLGWGMGFAMHFTSYLARRRGLIQRLGEAGLPWRDIRLGRRVSGGHRIVSGPSRVTAGMEHYELVREAQSIRDRLLRQLEEDKEIGKRMGSDVAELLSTYSDQLEKLVLRNDDFSKTVASLTESGLEREIQDYRAKVGGTEHPALRREYEKALEQSERHLKSVRELRHQKEIMDLRIQSSFGLLRQLELDFVRLKNAEFSGEVEGLASIRTKSHEISDYLEGLEEADRTV
jgi:hypothetical protein